MKKSIPTQKPSNTVKHFKPITTFTVTIRKNPIVPLKKRAINKNKLILINLSLMIPNRLMSFRVVVTRHLKILRTIKNVKNFQPKK